MLSQQTLSKVLKVRLRENNLHLRTFSLAPRKEIKTKTFKNLVHAAKELHKHRQEGAAVMASSSGPLLDLTIEVISSHFLTSAHWPTPAVDRWTKGGLGMWEQRRIRHLST
ncbi:hypothetical protein RRG08_064330 [Elysia crispata]|uniref:Uncharacterized protein n=1 Tax=Elysia crispata TaxID=231223 RepID=A0AAE1ADQ7_9GAST|nr:hypothetical protein RRG08_064330 [Elysia crispata]